MSSHYLPQTRIPTVVFPNSTTASHHAALHIERLIRQNNSAGRPTVLGLATGSTPIGLYRELIRLHREAGLDFSQVITFNLDEYYPMNPTDEQSYHRFMHENLFSHINIRPENVHIPDGTLPTEEVEDWCVRYEQAIRKAGGLDLQILGIGRTGHIGFNEPGSSRSSRTRRVTLDPLTRRDAAAAFSGEEKVPRQAITMGVGTILDAKQILILAFGEHKAEIVQKTLEGEVCDTIPATYLQRHPDTTFLLDEPAAMQLTAVRFPWLVGPVAWTPERIRQAVIWLALRVHKALLKLSDDDFHAHGLHELLREHGPVERLSRQVFEDRLATLTTRPGGPTPQTILIFSPHPDDDVISMGGTMLRLVEGGHHVHVAYMTSGNIAVFDHDALRFTDFVRGVHLALGLEATHVNALHQRVAASFVHKKPNEPDTPEVLTIKQLIRETEARAAARECGIPPEQLVFMNLRFYRTGTIAKKPIQPEDVADIVELIKRLRPGQIYVAGEMSDPHGTHRTCAEAVFTAVRQVRADGQDLEVWLYRGAWEEWEPHEIEVAVPLSAKELERKKEAIFRHQSQKDRAMFAGSDRREFWQRAEDRNRQSAKIYDELGLPEFYALEAFVRHRG